MARLIHRTFRALTLVAIRKIVKMNQIAIGIAIDSYENMVSICIYEGDRAYMAPASKYLFFNDGKSN